MPSNQVQIRRDSNANLNASTPATGELAYDTTNKRLRLGDGSTAGAIYTPNRIDLQNQAFVAVDAGGTADALTLTLPTGLIPSAYTKYQRFVFKATATNTTTATLNVNSLGAKTLKKMSSAGPTALVGGEIYSGQTYAVVYDGTDMLLESVPSSASSGSFVLLSTGTASGSATLDFTSVITSSHDAYMFVFSDIKPATDSTKLYMRTSTDNGSTYDSGLSDYVWNLFETAIGAGSADAQSNDTADSEIELTATGVGNATAEGVSGSLMLYTPVDTTRQKLITWEILAQTNTTAERVNRGYAQRVSTGDITAVRFLFASGNIASGKIYLYGLKNS